MASFLNFTNFRSQNNDRHFSVLTTTKKYVQITDHISKMNKIANFIRLIFQVDFVTMGAADTDNFCLRWNDFAENVSGAFKDLRAEKDFFDVTLACEDQEVHQHTNTVW